MTSSFVQVSAFNENLLKVLKLIHQKFPHDRNVSLIYNQVDTASRVTPRLTVVHFIKEISPFVRQVENRDQDFFLALVKEDGYKDVLSELDLHHKWSCLSEQDKEFIWTSIQTLNRLGRRILELEISNETNMTNI